MNILLSVNNKYVPYTGVLLQSLKDYNPGMPITVYILSLDITSSSKQKLQSVFTDKYCSVIFPKINDDVRGQIHSISLHLPKYMDVSLMLRLFVAQVIPETISYILYLDVDTLIISSIKRLEDVEFDKNTAIAAVKDIVREEDYIRLGIDKNKHTYFNSGVMLINVGYWREHNVSSKCIELFLNQPEKYKFPDQDLLNKVCEGKVIYLHPRFNTQLLFFSRREIIEKRIVKKDLSDIMEAISDPIIIHYVFLFKPWYKGTYIPKRDIWLEEAKKTGLDIPIIYQGGIKGIIKMILNKMSEYFLPFFGIYKNINCFTPPIRYRHMRFLALILYYGVAYYLPNFDARLFGRLSNRIRVWCVKNLFEYVGQGVRIGRKVRFGNGRNIRIGDFSNLGEGCSVPSNIVIGNNVMMGPYNFFFRNFIHNTQDSSRPMIEQGFVFLDGKLTIGDDVFIGRECMFMPCIKIGSHSIIGARSVVTKDVDDMVMVAGNPAQIRKKRS